MSERKKLVCVICGTPWEGPRNVCVNDECKGFCSWGEKKDGEPSSWIKTDSGYIPRPPPKNL